MVSIPQAPMPSNMSHAFSTIPRADIPRSQFKRSHTYKTTFDAGYLIPFYVDEALPGDTFNLKVSMLARLATPIKPLMDNLYMDTFFFAVPNRLLWSNWERFNGAQDNPADSTTFLVPLIDKTKTPLSTTGWTYASLADYFGIPTGIAGLEHTALWHRAYNLIWNQWFRDQNLQNSVSVPLTDGPDDPALYTLLRRGKRHDYFTSCLPWPQKGVGVSLPLGSTAPVIGIGAHDQTYNLTGGDLTVYETGKTVTTTYTHARATDLYPSQVMVVEEDPAHTGWPNIRADLSSATAATINSLRQAFQLQRLYERDARGGTRYVEILNAHFGVVSPDFRLQRPEYLGGGSTPIVVNPIVQNSVSAATPQGNLAGIGTGVSSHGFVKSFVEHCVIIGLVSVRADLTYQQGLPRMFSRRTRFDFYWPALAHLGEQAVLNKEIYAQATSQDEAVFGYQERWAEYRYGMSKITGKFRSTYATPLDIWHLSQKFTSLPTLNTTFIQENPPVDRVIAVSTEPHFIFDSFFNINCVRPMPVYSVPGLIDHF